MAERNEGEPNRPTMICQFVASAPPTIENLID